MIPKLVLWFAALNERDTAGIFLIFEGNNSIFGHKRLLSHLCTSLLNRIIKYLFWLTDAWKNYQNAESTMDQRNKKTFVLETSYILFY